MKNHVKCPECSGQGSNTEWVSSKKGPVPHRKICSRCFGSGKVVITTTETEIRETRVLNES